MSVIKRKDLITDEAVLWPKKYLDDLDKIIVASKKLGSSTAKKSLSELEKVQRSFALATKRSVPEIVKQKAALNTLNSETRQAVKDVQNHENAYYKLNKKLNDARKSYKNLAAAGNTNTKSAKAQLAQIKKLDSQLKKIDNSVGQNQRSVGKYSNAIKGVTARFLGWTAAIVLVGRAFSNAFKRIRAYDKAVVELSAILRVSRKDLSNIEKQIIKVAGASTKTSSEVADLAVALATLGKTEAEINKLLLPVNNLSIALKATSEEAGKLLVGTLNAFGESATEAQRYGDVIARLRTSSALDFQGIVDSLSFLAPTANAVGLSIEETAAIIGVLKDNSIKAARAGRLMSSSFARLNKKGLTLDDALLRINNSTDKVKTATELFGVQSFSLGLILAKNVDKTANLTIAYKNSTGALDELTEAQLKSYDAIIKLADSAWEKLILSITKGDNALSNLVKGSLKEFTDIINYASDLITGIDRDFENWKDNLREQSLTTDELTGSVVDLTAKIKEQEAILKTVNSISAKNARKEEIELLKKQRDFTQSLIRENKKLEKDKEKARLKEIEQLKEIERIRILTLQNRKNKTNEVVDELLLREFEKTNIQAKSLISIEEKLQRDLLSIKERAKEIEDIARDREIDDAQILADQKQDILNKSFDVASEIGNRYTALRIEQIGQELTAIEFARNRELETAGDNEREKFEINKKFDEEKRKLQKKQVITERANALFQIALNTAIGITNALSKVLTAPLVPFIVAMGAIQAAAVIAAPIPQFDDGTERTPKDYIAGEKRPELRKSKGKWSLVDKPTLFENSPGDKIVSGKETDSILGTISDLTGENMLTAKNGILALMNNNINMSKKKDNNLAYVLKRNNDELIKTIKNKKEVGITVSDSGTRVREKSGNIYVDRIDYYYKR